MEKDDVIKIFDKLTANQKNGISGSGHFIISKEKFLKELEKW